MKSKPQKATNAAGTPGTLNPITLELDIEVVGMMERQAEAEGKSIDRYVSDTMLDAAARLKARAVDEDALLAEAERITDRCNGRTHEYLVGVG